MKLTEKEQTVLTTLSEMRDHAPALGLDELEAETGHSQKSLKGIVGSLKKKGLVDQMNVNGTHQVTSITEKGEDELTYHKTKGKDTLKHEGYEVGEVIKAYDHKPRTWVEDGEVREQDFYVIGRITAIEHRYGAKVYTIDVMKDNTFTNEPREQVCVPMEVMGTEWDERVTKVHEA